jgi:TP901 family phage tail tape measure protein
MSGNILNFGIGVDLSGLTANTNRASSLITNFTNENQNRLNAFGERATAIGEKFQGLSVVLAGFATVSIYQFGQIDKSLREVNSLFNLTGEAADKNFGELVEISKQASNEVGLLQQDISKGLYDAISAGVPKDNAFDFIVTAGKAAIGGVTDLKTSVDGLTTVINAYGKDFDEVGAVSDSIFATIQGGKTTFAELSASLFNIAPAASAANVSMEEVNASIAALTASGTPTSVATTQIRAALVGLQRPSADMDKIFQKLGFQNAQLAIESKGLKFALDAVKTASKGNNGELQTLLGSVEAVAAVNVLAGTGSAKFTAELERQANAAGSAENAYNELEKSFPRQLERLKAQFSNISIEIGQRLAPLVGLLASGLQKLSDFWNSLDESTKDLIVTFGGMVAAIAPIALIIGKLIALAPAMGAAWALITGPIGLVVAGVVALTVAIVKNWDTIKIWAQDLANYFVDLYNESIVFRLGIEAIIFAFKTLVSVGTFVFSTLWEVVKNFVKNFIEAFKAVGGIIKGVLTFDWELIKKSAANGLASIISNSNKATARVVENFKNMFNDVGANAGNLVRESLEGKLERVKIGVDAVVESVSMGGGGGRKKEQGVGSLDATGVNNFNTQPTASIPEIIAEADTALLGYYEMLAQFDRDVNDLVVNSIGNTFVQLGDAIGNALANGTNVFEAIGQTLLTSISSFLKDLGKQFILFGTAALFFAKTKKAIMSGDISGASAIGLIAAGIALNAIGAVISQKAGGSVGGGSVGSNSVATPQSNVSSSTFAGNGDNEVVFRISGTDLLGVLRRAENSNARLG